MDRRADGRDEHRPQRRYVLFAGGYLLAWTAAGVAAYGLTGGGRTGRSDALLSGVCSGGWCICSSWALMAALFALGVMSLTWMVLIAALVALEKASPWPSAARLGTAIVLALLAVGIFAAPNDVPALVTHGSGGRHAMSAMG